jgi:hypothetical protein
MNRLYVGEFVPLFVCQFYDLRPSGNNLRPSGKNLRPFGKNLRPSGKKTRLFSR